MSENLEVDPSPHVNDLPSNKPGKMGKAVRAIAFATALTVIGTCTKECANSGINNVEAIKAIEPGKKRYRIKYNFENTSLIGGNVQSIARKAINEVLEQNQDDELDYYNHESIEIISVDHNSITGPEITLKVDIHSVEYDIRKREIETRKEYEEAKETIIEPILEEEGIYSISIPANLPDTNKHIILRNSLNAFQKQHPHLQITVVNSGQGAYRLLTFNH